MDNIEKDNLLNFANEQLQQELDIVEIEKKLMEKSHDLELIAEVMKEIKKIHHAIKVKSGLTKLIIGSVLLVIGFLITCVNFHNNKSFSMVMYGFTTVGLLLLFWGLYEIIG